MTLILPLLTFPATASAQVHASVTVGSAADALTYTDSSSGTNSTTIILGDDVTFTWAGTVPHSVTSTASDLSAFTCSPLDDPVGGAACGNFANSVAAPHSSGAISASSLGVGDWVYACVYHGTGMNGVVHVLQYGSATHYTVSNPGTQTAGVGFSVTVTALDRNNNVVANFDDSGATTFSATEGGSASFTPLGWSGGHETVNVTLHTAESQTITATDGGISGSSSFLVQPATATHYVLSAPGSTNQGAGFSVTVTAEDNFGNPSTTDNGAIIALNSSDGAQPGGSMSGSAVTISGVILRTTGSQTLSASGDLGTSNVASVTVGATHFAVSALGPAIAGSNTNFTVTAQDIGNATITNFADTVHITSSDLSATLPANFTLSSGMGPFSIVYNTVGSQSAVATDTLIGSVTGSTNVNVAPACTDAPKTFPNSAPITINDNAPATPYPSPITVSMPGQFIGKLTVTLHGFEHTFASDVDILLVHNDDGRKFVLMSNTATGEFSTLNPVDITFDDTAGGYLPSAGPMPAGIFKPTVYALSGRPIFNAPAPGGPYGTPGTAGTDTLSSIFGGTDPNGTWSLYVQDNVSFDSGNITGGWSLTITPAKTFNNTTPINYSTTGHSGLTATTDLYPSPIAVSGLPGNITHLSLSLNGLSVNTCYADLAVLLQGPGSQFIIPMSFVGSCFTPVSGINLTLDDDAGSSLVAYSSTPISGTFKPASYIALGGGGAQPLFNSPAPQSGYPSASAAVDGSATFANVFNGTDPNGVWNLYIQYQPQVNGAPADSGQLAGGWSLTIATDCPAATATTVGSSLPSGSTFGQPVTFTAGVTSGLGTPFGNVAFQDGGVTMPAGTVALDGTGHASYITSSLSPGSHNITAVYAGNTTYATSTSGIFVQPVSKDATTTIVSSSSPSVVYSHTVKFTAQVTANPPGAGNPTGTVTFKDGATTLGTGTLALVSGIETATYTTTSLQLSVGSHTITAVYGGNSNFLSSTSAGITQTVTRANSATALMTSLTPTVHGQSVTFTATVTSSNGPTPVPSGLVNFTDNGSPLASNVAVNASGVATTSTTTLTTGSHNIVATYLQSANYLTSTSATVVQVVNAAATTTALGTSGTPSVYKNNVTFTATVTTTAPGAGAPTGTVNFYDNGVLLGPIGLVPGGGNSSTAMYSTSNLGAGSHPITAVFAGSTDFVTSGSSIVTQVVSKATLSNTLTSSADPSQYLHSVTFTAILSSLGGAETGTLTLKDGATTLAGPVAVPANHHIILTTSSLAVGTHNITSVYSGDANFNGSSVTITPAPPGPTQLVNPENTTSALAATVAAAPATSSTFGQAVTFTATVSASVGTPTGTVHFLDNGTLIGSNTLDGFGNTTFTTSALAVGTHPITASYLTDGNFAASVSSALSFTVSQASTTTTLVSSALQERFRHTVTFTATVTSAGGTPAGTVQFTNNGVLLGSATLVSGHATLTRVLGPIGKYQIRANYVGNASFSASSSGILNQYRTPKPH